MAKSKQKLEWSELIIVLLMFLTLATNAFWLVVTRDLDDRLERQTLRTAELKYCYDNDKKPCTFSE